LVFEKMLENSRRFFNRILFDVFLFAFLERKSPKENLLKEVSVIRRRRATFLDLLKKDLKGRWRNKKINFYSN